MSDQRIAFWAIAELLLDAQEIGRLLVVAENEAFALESGTWALAECLSSRYRLVEYSPRIELAHYV